MTGRSAEQEQRYERAQGLLEEFFELRAQEAGKACSFEEFVERHSDLAVELRELWSMCGQVDQALGEGQRACLAQQAQVQQVLEGLASSRDFQQRYVVEEEVGKGGMGVVFRVLDRTLDRPLAMKVILGQVDTIRSGKTPPIAPRQLARFLNEAKITGHLDHPGIVPVHEVGVDQEGRAYFTMKLVKGRTLGEVFEASAAGDPEWSTPRVLGVIQRVCEALAFAHDRGVIHRDLKPANVMVGDFGEVYVMDWGLARRVGEREHEAATETAVEEELSAHLTRTREGQLLGTPAYMSPEQASGQLARVGSASDVYAIGAMLYQLVAGRAPYCKRGEHPSAATVVARILLGAPERLTSPQTPPELIAIIEKAMAREIEARYHGVRELSDDLQAFLAGRVVRAFRTGPWVELTKWVKRNKPLAASIGIALLLLIAGLTTSLVFKARSDSNAKLALDNAAEARIQTSIAKTNEEIAKSRADDVMRLSAFQRMVDLETEADRLWPAEPEKLPQYKSWLERAHELVAGLDPHGDDPGHRAQLATLRERAVPLTAEERDARRHAHPRFGELAKLEAKVAALRAAQGVRDGRAQPAAFALNVPGLPSDALGLNGLARPLVDPARTKFGRETEGLALARLAMEKVEDDESAARAGDTLAWALYANGLDDEALQESSAALEAAPPERRRDYEDQAVELRKVVEAARGGTTLSKAESELSALRKEVSVAEDYHFADEQDTWWHNQLQKLVADIESFADPKTGLIAGISPEHGWGIEQRMAFAVTVAERSVSGEEAQRLWSGAIASIADPKECPKYGGLRITPQLGLLPIGRDHDSGLWEFAHLQTGEPAVRGADGLLVLKEETGLVFVLLPGGTFQMGAQKVDTNDANYDPQAEGNEWPVHAEKLSAFFLSKYEMTQGQWIGLTDKNPSSYGPGSTFGGKKTTLLHPVEQVSWTACTETLARLCLDLPTEAEWEYSARGKTTSAWWTGDEKESLQGTANLADSFCRQNGGFSDAVYEEWDDGHTIHAPVGSYSPNPFGLHDTIGNVWEWCRDCPNDYGRVRSEDGQREEVGLLSRVTRGGSFLNAASNARSASRSNNSPLIAGNALGVRPARRINP